jgi:hypothetical protein
MLDIEYNKKQKEKFLFMELLTRIEENQEMKAKETLNKFKQIRWSIVEESIKNPQKLIRWLYEQQGERRFDAANRLFLVLIDKNNFEESWKMKRNLDFLKNNINSYLAEFQVENIDKFKIEFDWVDGKRYSAISDVIFVVKN